MSSNLTKVEQIEDVKIILNKIVNPDYDYSIIQQGIYFPVFTVEGSEAIERWGSNNWNKIFNSGHKDFINGMAYKIMIMPTGKSKASIVWTQTAHNMNDTNSGLSDNIQNNDRNNNQNNNYHGFSSNSFKSLADVFQVQTASTVEALKQELNSKDNYIGQLQESLTKLYETIEKKNESFTLKEMEYIKQLEAERMKSRQSEMESRNEIWKMQQEVILLKSRHELNRDFEKKKRQIESANEVGFKDLIGLAPQLMGMMGGKPPLTPPTLTNQAPAPAPIELEEV